MLNCTESEFRLQNGGILQYDPQFQILEFRQDHHLTSSESEWNHAMIHVIHYPLDDIAIRVDDRSIIMVSLDKE
jgi:hypothetical protein